MSTRTVYTIGHSTHPLERFIRLLVLHRITAVCDVRSRPYSHRNPHFNRVSIQEALKESNIAYAFLGRELGARSEDSSCYQNGRVQFDRLAKTALFRKGLERVQKGMKEYRLALMCAEKDPLECHRTILISRYLDSPIISVQHILEEGALESHQEALSRLLHQLHLPERDMFRTPDDMVQEAYRVQSERIAYDERVLSQQQVGPVEKGYK